jgi:hypothetical protein
MAARSHVRDAHTGDRHWLKLALQSLAVLTVWLLVAFLTIRWLADDGTTKADGSSPTPDQLVEADSNHDDHEPAGRAAADATTAPTVAVDGGTAVDGQAAVEACEERWQAQGRPLHAAQQSMDQWRLHIDAMNQLVAGKITLAQASAFWEQTRVGALGNVKQFRDEDSLYDVAALPCARAGEAAQTGDAQIDSRLASCVDAVRSSDRVLRVARVAVGTWEHHVHDMERLRDGLITPAQATEMWLASWRVGNRELARYDKAQAQALQSHCR